MRHSHVSILGAPLDLGAGRRGVDMGPSAIRLGGLHKSIERLGHTVEDLGNIPVEQPESASPGESNAKYLTQIQAACWHLAQGVERIADAGQFPLVLGGDHSVAIGTVSGLAQSYRKRGQQLGLIWVDAHADMNTPETSPSGNVHGMPLACIIGQGPPQLTQLYDFSPKVQAKHVVLVGIRDVDLGEGSIVRSSGVHYFTMRDIDEKGMRYVMKVAADLASNGTDGFHCSFDMDSVDPDEAPGVGTAVRGGLSYREAHLAMEIVSESGQMRSLEVVEVNPVLDIANRTALLAVELIASALGKRIV